ncbi:uncharacterized protein BDZ99DRAFT_448126 [Mytilinidion resinicola]|uniref:Rhodopsin domain-containing protein n=1 Tax=Mytilinidion resinicola TaxID=574789 RepID=A0A6A6YDK5_9PEZI|nr:uncharacterized protein BDZ99DRAFT_448126 [Mytilinidion resinicola]KAF2806679.1 hypothetical protein BDZ99DRAFT_448126 [Mytilinidion resinicola]
MWTFFALATIGLAFRFYTRIKCFCRLLADDYLAGFAWFLLLVSACIWDMTIDGMYEVTRVSAGLQQPSANFQHNAHRFLVGSNVALVMFYVGLWTIKLSFLVFFYRLGNQIRRYQIMWWIVTAFTIASGLACVGSIQYHCLSDPFEKVYMNCSKDSAIRFQEVTLKVNCALDVFTDVLIMSLPISLLWSVRVSFGRKVVLAGLFSLVLITMVIAIVRVTVVSKGYVVGHRQAEISWLYFWSFTEFAVAILVACLASFRALFAQKERQSEAEVARKRELAQRDSPSGGSSRALWARAKFFQQSLFETEKTVDQETKRGGSDDFVPLSDISGSERGESRATGDAHSIQGVSKLESQDGYIGYPTAHVVQPWRGSL